MRKPLVAQASLMPAKCGRVSMTGLKDLNVILKGFTIPGGDNPGCIVLHNIRFVKVLPGEESRASNCTYLHKTLLKDENLITPFLHQ